jgi:hypothetical protein
MPASVFVRASFLALLATVAASAAPLCVSAPLSTYTAAGFECEIDSALFSDFSFFATGSVTTTALDEDEITVSPLSGLNQVGLRFEGDFESTGNPNGPGPAEGNLNVSYRFFFDVDRPFSEFVSATTILNNPFRFSPNPLKFGAVLAGKSIANDGALASVLDTDPDLMETANLNTPRQMIAIDELLSLTGGASAEGTVAPVGFVTLDSVDNLFTYQTVVPEPGVLSLLAGGMVLLAAVMAHRRPRGR